MIPFVHPEVRETRGRPLSGEPVGRATICVCPCRRCGLAATSEGWGGKASAFEPLNSRRQLTRERKSPSPIAVGPTGRNRSRRQIDPTIHPAGGSTLSSLAPHVTGGAMAGWQARRHVCPRTRSGASGPVLNLPPYLAGGFALPAIFQTLHDPHRRVSKLRPHRQPSVAPNRNHGAPGQCVPTSRTNQP